MRALLDVNVLIAVHDPDHLHHARALDWLAAEIQAAIDDPRPSIPHAEVMARMDAQLARLNADRSAEHTAQQTP